MLLLLLGLSACKDSHQQYNGFIDADLTYLSSDTAGRLVTLQVRRGEAVRPHQSLFIVEQTHERRAVKMSELSQDELRAQRESILSQLQYAESNYHRILRMNQGRAASNNDLEVAKRDWDVLKDNLAVLELQLQNAQVEIADKAWLMKRKANESPIDALVFDTYFTEQEYVQAGQPVLALITKQHIKAVFFVPETALSGVQLEAPAKISSDGTPNLAKGKVCYISPVAQYTPPIIYSRELREALVFRVEVCIEQPNLKQIHLGQPVSVELG